MINITEKKKMVAELVQHSSLCELLDMKERLLQSLANLPDELDERDLPLLNGIETMVKSSEEDADMKGTVEMFLRLDEIGRRRSANPDAPIDDLLGPITS